MGKTIFTILFVMLFSGPVLGFTNGNELLRDCEAEPGVNSGVCYGYIRGIADAGSSNGQYCIPEGVKVIQVKEIVVKFLNENPKMLNSPNYSLVHEPLLASFPCK